MKKVLMAVLSGCWVLGVLFGLSACNVSPLNQGWKEAGTGYGDEFEPALMSQIEGYTLRASGDPEAGERLFNLICTDCHRYLDTNDESTLGFGLKPEQASGAPVLSDMGSDVGQGALTDSYLSATIQYGKGENVGAHSMPAWGEILTDTEVNNLVAFIKQVKAVQRTRSY